MGDTVVSWFGKLTAVPIQTVHCTSEVQILYPEGPDLQIFMGDTVGSWYGKLAAVPIQTVHCTSEVQILYQEGPDLQMFMGDTVGSRGLGSWQLYQSKPYTALQK